MMGQIAATLLSRMAVPVVYYLIARRGRAAQMNLEGLTAGDPGFFPFSAFVGLNLL
ncbi:MAG: hypothetical protein K1Y01_14655 [Vicinamibacteria bacterium]|nr:hypothetical protein [Vicinamibacteria bacterium]